MESSSGTLTFCMTTIFFLYCFPLQFNLFLYFFYEARLPDPTDCDIRNGECIRHLPNRVLQIFSLKLAKLSMSFCSVEFYGYIVVRDGLDPLLNYVVNISRDDPIIVEQVRILTYLQLFHGISLLNPLKYNTRHLAA